MSLEHATSKGGGKTYLNSKQVRQRYGDVSDMTIWRWLRDPSLNFPAPLKINGRRLWAQDSLEKFEAERAADSGEPA